MDDKNVTEPIACVKSESLDDWWLIERAQHDGAMWLEPCRGGASLMTSARITNADIEGTSDEMLAIAHAIEQGESISFRRCAAVRVGLGYALSSPRNSMYAAIVPLLSAQALARDIRAKVTAAATGAA
jgi:hypothetical protein